MAAAQVRQKHGLDELYAVLAVASEPLRHAPTRPADANLARHTGRLDATRPLMFGRLAETVEIAERVRVGGSVDTPFDADA